MFTEEEKSILSKYVTSADADVFAIRNMQGMAGAAYARYSRAKGGFREVLLKEFLEAGVVDAAHADQLIERILIAYGDDSVGELEGAHVSFEKITMLAAKEIEDRRIGGSPIEQSTRYVLYDQKREDGHFMYYRGDDVLKASFGKQYEETMDFVFQTYSDLVEPLKNYLESQKDINEAEYDINGDGVKEKFSGLKDEKEIKAFKQTYTFDLRAKACDILRSFLPVATQTNVGMFGNGRFFQNLISYLLTSDIPENNALAAKSQEALRQVIPQYIRRAAKSEYNAGIQKAMYELAAQLLGKIGDQKQQEPSHDLLDRGGEVLTQLVTVKGLSGSQALSEAQDISILACMLYPYADMGLRAIRAKVESFDAATREKIRATYIGDRKTRRDRPGRALEDGYPYTFDNITTFGTYKDLQRHRMNTQARQLFTPHLGFCMPKELAAVGGLEKAKQAVEKIEALYEVMAKENPVLAQYAVMHGHFVRWYMGFNDREAMHLLELRSTPQGHPQYRQAAQEMHKLIAQHSAWRGEAMKFVDHNDYYWSRADSEAKQRVKEAKWEEKYDKKA